jgi:multiple sugar transport system substrate-binding protein
MRRFRGNRVGFWLVFFVIGLFAGCGWSGSTSKPAAMPLAGARIVVAAVGDQAVLGTVKAQLGEWQASRGASCTVLDKPVEPAAGNAHVLVFRGDRLGDLVDAGALMVLPESLVQPPARHGPDGQDKDSDDAGPAEPPDPDSSEAEALQFSDVLPAFRDQVSKSGPDRVALPLGGSALVLVTNLAAFDRAENRAAAKDAGVALEPPKTWKDLDALARFFHGRDWHGDGENAKRHGIALAFGPDPEGVGDAIYLARAAALGQHRDHYSLLFDSDTMEPRLASPPFVEALEGLVALKAFAPPDAAEFDAEAARLAFRDGKVVLLIDRAERAGRWGGGAVKRIGVSPLPGSERVYDPANKKWETASPPNRPSYLPFGGGWLVAVAASARGREREAAVDFARYLINPETSNRVRSDRDFPMLPVRGAQISQGLADPRSAPGVDPRLWSDAVSKTLLALQIVPGLRIPQADGYLADLAKGRLEAMNGRPAEEALKAVATAWSARTKALGPARQLWHYKRSLNSRLVTTPRPPDR